MPLQLVVIAIGWYPLRTNNAWTWLIWLINKLTDKWKKEIKLIIKINMIVYFQSEKYSNRFLNMMKLKHK